jgi:putative NADPH-quinone reductase
MRVLLLFCHPVETSYQAALHRVVQRTLEAGGHAVDDCDLYAEQFDPVLSREDRLVYHDETKNRVPVAPYVERLLAAEGLVLVFPVWNFGLPAMLKGFFDRVLLPGVAFRLTEDGGYRPDLTNLRQLAAVTTYGQPRWKALLVGDPPKRFVTRVLRSTPGRLVPTRYLAHYDMNRSTDTTRQAFLTKVEQAMARF